MHHAGNSRVAGLTTAARRLGVETPIIDEVVSLLHAEKSASEGMHALLSRELRSEE
jgi:glycerol-3-phosphate dehydrogenase